MPTEPISENLRPSAVNRESAAKLKHGGRRPGAGAPKGNLNGLKHGLRSKQVSQFGMALAANPKTRETLINLGRRHHLKQQKAEEVAALFLSRLIERGVKIQTDDQKRKLKTSMTASEASVDCLQASRLERRPIKRKRPEPVNSTHHPSRKNENRQTPNQLHTRIAPPNQNPYVKFP